MKFLRLYRARTNAMNIYVVEDTITDKYIVADWDLSENAEKELIQRFEAGEITGEENDGRWETEEEAFGETFNRDYIGLYTDDRWEFEIGFEDENNEFYTLTERGFAPGKQMKVELPITATFEEIKNAFKAEFLIDDFLLSQCNKAHKAAYIQPKTIHHT